MSGEGRRTGFYGDAQRQFRSAHDSLTVAPSGKDFARVMLAILDSGYVGAANWLLVSSVDSTGRHPRGAIHEIKKSFRAINRMQADGKDIDPALVGSLRRQVLSFYRTISRVVRATLIETGWRTVDLRGLLAEVCARYEGSAGRVAIRLVCPRGVPVETQPVALRLAFQDLLDNAVEASSRLSDGGIVLVNVRLTGEGPGAAAVLTITNPYDPHAVKEGGSGIGSEEAYYLLTELCGGTLRSLPHPEQREYEVVVQLPVDVV